VRVRENEIVVESTGKRGL